MKVIIAPVNSKMNILVSTTDLNSLEIDFSISILSLGEIFLIEGVSTINQKILPPTHAVAEIR
ncbi:MAG: hypothetical protein MK345_05745 [SAR202 cluster bacterium]|nr:hypothetical protein [SAR202 cluster bacterium]